MSRAPGRRILSQVGDNTPPPPIVPAIPPPLSPQVLQTSSTVVKREPATTSSARISFKTSIPPSSTIPPPILSPNVEVPSPIFSPNVKAAPPISSSAKAPPPISSSAKAPPPISSSAKAPPISISRQSSVAKVSRQLPPENISRRSRIITTPTGSYTESDWIHNLQDFLDKTLNMIEQDANKRYRYLTAEAMNIWVKAFTHASVDYENNYEVLETLGDRVLDLYFLSYAIATVPGLGSDGYSDIIHFYQNEESQGIMSNKYGFYNMLAIGKNIENKMRGDVFESFYGALFTVGNMVFAGLGGVLVHNMIKFMYDQEKVVKQRKDAKSEISFMFNKFREGDEARNNYFNLIKRASHLAILDGETFRDPITGEYIFYVIIPKRINEFIERNNINIISEKITISRNGDIIIGVGKDIDSNKAEKKAYEDALSNLERAGFTPLKAIEIKQEDMFSGLHQELVRKAKEKARKEQISLIFVTPKHTALTVQLQGILSDGKSVNLTTYSYLYRTGIKDAREYVLQKYLEE